MSGFDVEAYIGNYQGFTRVKRMGFISGQNSALKADVLRTAVDEVKKTTNTVLYIELITMAGDTPGLGARDDAWVEAEDKKAAHRLEKLENDLSQHKTSLVKESIRMGHNDLGDFHSARGDFVTALKCYVRTRDYCTTPRHVVNMCLNVIRVSVESENFAQVQNYVAKATQVPDVEEPMVAAKLACAAGLAAIEARKYKLAAEKFTDRKSVV